MYNKETGLITWLFAFNKLYKTGHMAETQK